MARDDEEPWRLNPNITPGKELAFFQALSDRAAGRGGYPGRKRSLFMVPMLFALGTALVIFLATWLFG